MIKVDVLKIMEDIKKKKLIKLSKPPCCYCSMIMNCEKCTKINKTLTPKTKN
jgi:hypothetical protein